MKNNNREGRMSRGDREMTNALRHQLFLSASKEKFRENLRILISYREFSATNTQNGGNK